VAALNPKRARILMGGLLAAGVIFTVLVLALDEDGRPGFPAGVRLPAETAEGASWSQDGRWVAIPNRAGVLLRDPDGERNRQLRAPRTPRVRGAIPGRIGWSPDGNRLRYVTTDGPEAGKGAWLTEIPVAGGPARQVALGAKVRSAGWSPRGWQLVYVPAQRAGLWSLTAIDGKPKRLLDLGGRESRPQASPDGTRILFTLRRSPEGAELWIARADGSAARRLAGPFIDLRYDWAPNSRRVAIVAVSGTGPYRLFVAAARNGNLRPVPGARELFGDPAWTPGGRWITYATEAGGIEKLRPRGGKAQKLAGFPGEWVGNLLWSPNGKRLAYSSEEIPERNSD